MSDNGTTKENGEAVEFKGKGKGAAEPETKDASMDTEDSSSEEEVDETAPVADEEDDDNMEEIDLDNIIQGGRRTRGRQIDFAKAAKDLPEEDDDEDEDDDFQAPNDDDKMEE